ncbi:RNA polymerase I enhancer binding protein [Dissophora globulifera]|uniref:RNA polymerase I enhancer binding protein n=1 Tax=Dissophora globulifera TaxID=979702 RepID=A0A9P6RWQ0_9FUNG|nr:RNA polymerase I enhancer binding protein [Dissophora globulifera]
MEGMDDNNASKKRSWDEKEEKQKLKEEKQQRKEARREKRRLKQEKKQLKEEKRRRKAEKANVDSDSLKETDTHMSSIKEPQHRESQAQSQNATNVNRASKSSIGSFDSPIIPPSTSTSSSQLLPPALSSLAAAAAQARRMPTILSRVKAENYTTPAMSFSGGGRGGLAATRGGGPGATATNQRGSVDSGGAFGGLNLLGARSSSDESDSDSDSSDDGAPPAKRPAITTTTTSTPTTATTSKTAPATTPVPAMRHALSFIHAAPKAANRSTPVPATESTPSSTPTSAVIEAIASTKTTVPVAHDTDVDSADSSDAGSEKNGLTDSKTQQHAKVVVSNIDSSSSDDDVPAAPPVPLAKKPVVSSRMSTSSPSDTKAGSTLTPRPRPTSYAGGDFGDLGMLDTDYDADSSMDEDDDKSYSISTKARSKDDLRSPSTAQEGEEEGVGTGAGGSTATDSPAPAVTTSMRGAALWSALEAAAEGSQRKKQKVNPADETTPKSKGKAPKVPKASRKKRTVDEQMETDMAGMSDNILHVKWMMADELKERGLAYKKGPFSAQEDRIIREVVSNYIARNNKPADLLQLWFQDRAGNSRRNKTELLPLWTEITTRLETRPLMNTYLHVRRLYHPENNLGPWSAEDDSKLRELYAKHKGQWSLIGEKLGRLADSCRDRYRDHVIVQGKARSGQWQPEEDERLLDILQDFAELQGKQSPLDAVWTWAAVSDKMDGTRSRPSCNSRYSYNLLPKLMKGKMLHTRAGRAAHAYLSDRVETEGEGADTEDDGEGKINRSTVRVMSVFDTLRLLQEHGYTRVHDVDWELLYKEQREAVKACHDAFFEKMSQAVKYLTEPAGPERRPKTLRAGKAALHAMKTAITRVRQRADRLHRELHTPLEMAKAVDKRQGPLFVRVLQTLEGSGQQDSFTEYVKEVIRQREMKQERRDQSEGNKATRLGRTPWSNPRSTVAWHEYLFLTDIHYEALETLLTQFQELRVLVTRELAGISGQDRNAAVSVKFIDRVVDNKLFEFLDDNEQHAKWDQMREDRHEAERLISEALVEVGLPAIPVRRTPRAKKINQRAAGGGNIKQALTNEYVENSDSDDTATLRKKSTSTDDSADATMLTKPKTKEFVSSDSDSD